MGARLFSFRLFLILAVVAVAVLVPSARPPEVQAGCVAALTRGGVDYTGIQPPGNGKLHLGRRLGRVRVPPCTDTIPADPDQHDTVHRLRRIQGVPPAVALFDGYDGLVYAANGYFPQLSSHPLHGLYPAREFAAGVRACQVRKPIQGRVTGKHFGVIRLRSKRQTQFIQVGPSTEIRGFLRHGLPHLEPGDRIKMSLSRCKLRKVSGSVLLARTVAAR